MRGEGRGERGEGRGERGEGRGKRGEGRGGIYLDINHFFSDGSQLVLQLFLSICSVVRPLSHGRAFFFQFLHLDLVLLPFAVV